MVWLRARDNANAGVEFPDEFDVVTERVKARLAELYETYASPLMQQP